MFFLQPFYHDVILCCHKASFKAEVENIRKWADGGTNWYAHILNKLKGFYCKPKAN